MVNGERMDVLLKAMLLAELKWMNELLSEMVVWAAALPITTSKAQARTSQRIRFMARGLLWTGVDDGVMGWCRCLDCNVFRHTALGIFYAFLCITGWASKCAPSTDTIQAETGRTHTAGA